MSRRRFATRSTVATSACLQSLLDRTPGARPPMEVALLLAHDVLRSTALVHSEGRTCGAIDAASFEVAPDGHVSLKGEGGGTDVLADVQAVGGVLYQLFTGLTVSQARARLQVPRLHEVPAPARLNPTLDDELSAVVASMLASDPVARPYSLAHVLSDVLDVMDDLGLSHDEAVVAAWASLEAPAAAPVVPLAVVAPPVVAKPVVKAVPVAAAPLPAAKQPLHRAPPRSWQTDDDEQDLDDEAADTSWAEPVRFDAWALLACCFAIASLAIVFNF
ncbi:MAG: hypothetical protein AB1938_22130 [Myxococcota bacterium]